MSDSGSSSDLLNDLAHEFAERCRRGEHPALTEYTDKHPDLDKAAKLKPDDPQVWDERGRIYAEHGQPDKAAADFARSKARSRK